MLTAAKRKEMSRDGEIIFEAMMSINGNARTMMVKMPYIGSDLSVNHYKFGTYQKKPEVIGWMNQLGWEIKSARIQDWKQPITVNVSGVFKNEGRCPDTHNLLKVICDAIQDVTGLNDKYYRTETEVPVIDKTREPTLIIRITEGL